MLSAVEGITDILMALLILRLLTRPQEAFFNPAYGLIYKVTDPLLVPFRYVVRRIPQAVVLAVGTLAVLRGLIYSALVPVGLMGAVGQSFMDLVKLVFQGYMVFWVLGLQGPRSYGGILDRIRLRAFSPLESLCTALRVNTYGGRLLLSFLVLLGGFMAVQSFLRGVFILEDIPSPLILFGGLVEGLILFIGLFPFPGFFSVVIIAGALLSWFSPDPRNPLVQAIYSVSEPLLAPFKRFIPLVGAIDITPIVALLTFQLVGGGLQRLILEAYRSLF